jgi:hypothetical protein
VQFGPQDELLRVHDILRRLHEHLPELVAKPLACQPWNGDTFVQIQSGLPGLPWFRLANQFRSRAAWAGLRARAADVLARLHAVVRRVPEWSARLNPALELRRQSGVCVQRGVGLSPRARDRINEWAEPLERLAGVPWFWQHGDFCLNNLLVSPHRLAVIDFEEFGYTSMPLHDEVGLALSVNALAREAGRVARLAEDLRACLGQSDHRPQFGPEYWPGLFAHHLLWRINQSHDWPTRSRIRAALVGLVEKFAAAPAAFLST